MLARCATGNACTAAVPQLCRIWLVPADARVQQLFPFWLVDASIGEAVTSRTFDV